MIIGRLKMSLFMSCISGKVRPGKPPHLQPEHDDSFPPEDEVRQWAESFDKVMFSCAGQRIFREFLRSEYSEENLLFWLACEELKHEDDPKMIEDKARLIYEDYVSIFSPTEVSLDAKVRDAINVNIVQPTRQTFDAAQLQIYTLMKRDSYPRFLNSDIYRKLLFR
jgi:regulator of G-protein signaling